jgi:IS30 family transposase
MIERWYNREHLSKKEIAERLDKSERTIRREIKRGLTLNLNTYLEEIMVYSADIAQEAYEENLKAKGKELKIGSNINIVKRIELMIKEEKKSPEVIAYELKKEELIDVTGRTIRNYIYDGNVFDLSKDDMIYNKEYKNKNNNKRIAKHTPPEKSIENRPKEANSRTEYGHWEGDLIIGKRKKGCVLLTFTERMTREEIIIKIKGKNTDYVVKAINSLERKYGKRFYNKFKTITFDNGIEFMDYEGMEKSCLRKGKRTQIYYAHPYCSGERGTNENSNRMIRRWIPKGTLIDDIPKQFIQEVEDWINNYPRAMFDYKSSNMILSNI